MRLLPVRVGALAAASGNYLRHAQISSCEPSETVDSPVVIGDAVSLIGYGGVQAMVDYLLTPLAKSSPELFTQTDVISAPASQGAAIAIVWIALSLWRGGYAPSTTRTMPNAVLACLVPWVGSTCCLLLGIQRESNLITTMHSVARCRFAAYLC